ncbi:MAG: 30S ribosomal protein S12 methylthiotransferase RimO [Bacilli bacterium]|jgi:ribosomal protein S12 methylthiotransferase|nr:30S ribosomal protein S12 methylthiotransferase RimO [Bacilli bacterium]
MHTIGLVSLGCAKNLVDSEMILGMFQGGDYRFTDDPAQADCIIVNTCGFIADAKKEAIQTILEMAQYPGKLVVVGCFVERDLEELRKSIAEVDLWVPLREYKDIHKKIESLLGTDDIAPLNPLKRVVSTPSYCAYLRLSEGCDNFCAFCAIPYIRGRFASRPYEEIIEEAKMLRNQGVKVLSLVSQDTARYGSDFPARRPGILDLLKELDGMGFYSLRLLYLYPDEISSDLIDFVKASRSVAPYFDVPIQSGSDHVLKLMNRHGDRADMVRLFKEIKEKIPGAILRTTLIAGFPEETEEDQKETLSLMEEVRFDHLGCFTYSREEGTLAYKLPGQVQEGTKKRRRDEIMAVQRKISYERNKKLVGRTMEGLVTGYDPKRKLYTLRSYWNAPDDIDGNVFFASPTPLKNGEIASVRITSSFIYDLLGEKV